MNGELAWFRKNPRIEVVPIEGGYRCVVIDDALADPDALVEFAARQVFEPAQANAYPGLLTGIPHGLMLSINAFFDEHVRSLLGGRRRIDGYARLGLITRAPASLHPNQRLCHRDPMSLDPRQSLMAASVLYLFRNAALGGTSFYRPRCSEVELASLLAGQSALSNEGFSERFGLTQGYMTAGNAFFEQIAHVPAAWNRWVFYNGGVFHSGQIDQPDLLDGDPRRGRLTLNAFIACRRAAS